MKKFLSFALTVLVVPALAADGDLDLTFGIGGRVTTDFAGSFDGATALAIQSDGKIVAAGMASSNQGGDFGISRYNGDGSLDTTFGIGGKVTTDFSGRGDGAHALAIQSDGRIVAAGGANSGNHLTIRPIPPELQGSGSDDFGLVRYNTDGSLDTTFGIGGKVTTDFSGRVDRATALAIQSDGKIVVVGEAYVDGLVREDFALARYNSDGSLDTTFGIGGRVTTDLSGLWDRAHALAIQSDGKIVVAGEAYVANPIEISGLARYNSDGSLDMTFGIAGKVLAVFERWGAGANALAIQTDGKIVAAGWAWPASYFVPSFGLARYNQDGSPDTTFGIGGEVITNRSNASGDFLFGYANAMAILPDGKILAVGEAVGYPDSMFGLVRYNSDGSLDTTFGTGGKVTTKFGLRASASAFAIQSDGRIIAAGRTADSGVSDFALARYNNAGLLLVTGIQFDRTSVRVGDSWKATFSGANLTDQTYFDVRFRSPGSSIDEVALNWQRGMSATYNLAAGTAIGTWIVTGIRAHDSVSDHGGEFVSVSASITVER